MDTHSTISESNILKFFFLSTFAVPRSFYIRFAKITLRNPLQTILPAKTGYNVVRYQGFSPSTSKPVLASDLY
jgi:hypothetical protein